MRKLMKKLNWVISGLLIAQLANAQAPAQAVGKTIKLNPATLRSKILESNISILTELNQVHAAKDQINIARGNLLPSLNLSGLMTGSATFLLSGITALVPFFLPSNWLNISVQKAAFEAEKDSYWIMQLNTYSSALAMYYTMLADQKTHKIYSDEAEDLKNIYLTLKKKSEVLHTVSADVLNHAKSQYESAAVQASSSRELEVQELAAIRSVLGESLATNIVFDTSMMAASTWEDKNIQSAVDQAYAISPEHRQNLNLIESSRKARTSSLFSFLSSASLASSGSTSGSNPSSASFGNLTPRGSVNLGFATAPTYELNSKTIYANELRETALKESTTKILEAAMNSIVEAKKQVELSAKAEAEMLDVYDVKLQRYNLGLGVAFMTVLLARTQAVATSLQHVNAELDLNLQRVTMHRALLTDEFAQIKGCQGEVMAAQGGFFKNLFGGKKADISLDQACHAALRAANAVEDESTEE